MSAGDLHYDETCCEPTLVVTTCTPYGPECVMTLCAGAGEHNIGTRAYVCFLGRDAIRNMETPCKQHQAA